MKRITLAAALLVALAAGTAFAVDYNSASSWFKGILYTGTSRVALTNSTGNLSTTSGTFSGDVTVGGSVLRSVSSGSTAAGSSKTDCTQVNSEINLVSTATAMQGVCLPPATAGAHQFVYNLTSVSIVVYPLDSSDDVIRTATVGSLPTDQGWVLGPRASLDCTATSTTAWLCTFQLGVSATGAAAGTGQTTATALASVNMGSYVRITASDGTKGITLPSGSLAGCTQVFNTVNTSTAYLPVFGSTSDSDTINGVAGSSAFTMGAGADVRFCTQDGTAWVTY